MNLQLSSQPVFKGLVRPVLVSAVFFMLLTGLGYPLATTLVANLLFPFQAQGSLIERDGVVIGSRLIGQNFTRADYFQPRPSATVTADPADASKTIAAPYNAGASGGSNLGPTSQKLIDAVKVRAADYRQQNQMGADAQVPVDAVTASASGLDPHISVANARLQALRVAEQRHLPLDRVLELVQAQTDERTLGLLGEPRVNVLQLNLALDEFAAARPQPLSASE